MTALEALLMNHVPSQGQKVVDEFIAANEADITNMLCIMMMANLLPHPTPSGKFGGPLCLFFRDDRWPLVHFTETAQRFLDNGELPYSCLLKTDLSPEVTRADTLNALQNGALSFLVSARMAFRSAIQGARAADSGEYVDRLHDLEADLEVLNLAFDHMASERLANAASWPTPGRSARR